MRTIIALLFGAFLIGGCADWTAEDTLNAGGKLLYDTFKAKQEAEDRGY